MAMSQEEEKKEPDNSGFRSYPYSDHPRYGIDRTRYDGFYDASKYKENEKAEEEALKSIKITFNVSYKDLGPESDMDNEAYQYDTVRDEMKAKEIAYDRLTELVKKDFSSKYVMHIEATDQYDAYEVEITLTPV